MHYDLIVIGGGIAGSSLARKMALNGARVLVLEKETEFRDRVRGECMQPWGVAEAKLLGVESLLRPHSDELRYFEQSINGQVAMRRDLAATTPHQVGMLAFYHPKAQEMLLEAASAAGAEVRRGATAVSIAPGSRPKVVITSNGGVKEDTEARLVVISCGRNPALRTELGFAVRRGSIPLMLSGVWISGLSSDVDHSVAYIGNNVISGAVCALFPQPGDHARAYFGFHPSQCVRLQGDRDFGRFKDEFLKCSGDVIPLGDPQQCGPLASFDCVDVWVDHPYRDGVALVGDAASSNDPSWGQGLSLALRDARVLAEELMADANWDAAANRYAARHDQHYFAVRTVSGWFYDIFQRLGPVADARRARALPLIAQDPTRVPDTLFSGPDFQLQPNSRSRFFGEDTEIAIGQAG